jgi:hypothetical protein
MTKQHLTEGGTVYVQGHQFTIRNLRTYTDSDGEEVARFEGECTSDDRNNDIRGTCYNRGTYGGNHLRYTWDIA